MKLLLTRRYNKETYDFYLDENANGKYIMVKTPENSFGYTDTIILSQGLAYTLHRYLPNWILNRIEAKMLELTKQYCIS